MHDGLFLLLLPPLSVGPVLAFLKADLLGPWGLPTKIRLTSFKNGVETRESIIGHPCREIPNFPPPKTSLLPQYSVPLPPSRYQSAPVFLPM